MHNPSGTVLSHNGDCGFYSDLDTAVEECLKDDLCGGITRDIVGGDYQKRIGAIGVRSSPTGEVSWLKNDFCDDRVPVYRSSIGFDHIYSTSPSEGPSQGYTDEGVAFYLNANYDGDVAVERAAFRSSSYFDGSLTYHFYAKWFGQISGVGYTYTGTLGYGWRYEMADTVPLYRYTKARDYIYTTDWSELEDGNDGC